MPALIAEFVAVPAGSAWRRLLAHAARPARWN